MVPKTARKVKSLRAPQAFVLTGTPIENRIDELYSIVQYLDPELLGPLFRFNRDFYQLDERGRPTDYKNLGQLRERVRPLMLRRRKQDVETELPGRTVKTYFVAMAEEQQLRYDDYKYRASQLLAIAQRRPLTPKEFERLQQLLACMRMICDTPAILDPTCRVSPKLEELERILADLLEDPERKVIILLRMGADVVTMVREVLAAEMGVEAACRHSGSVPQNRRRAEINRFKNDPACRLFLSTDSGSVGLNLQVASAVINMDLPWNPAKLEQRIARAWRKNQTRSVSVVNLVAEGTIEHQILHLIGQKQALADGVIDGEGDLDTLKMPSGRGAFIERMQAMMEKPAAPARMVSATEKNSSPELLSRHGEKLSRRWSKRGKSAKACCVCSPCWTSAGKFSRRSGSGRLSALRSNSSISPLGPRCSVFRRSGAAAFRRTRRVCCTAPLPCNPSRRMKRRSPIGAEPAARWRRRIARCEWPRHSPRAASPRRRRRCSPARCAPWSTPSPPLGAQGPLAAPTLKCADWSKAARCRPKRCRFWRRPARKGPRAPTSTRCSPRQRASWRRSAATSRGSRRREVTNGLGTPSPLAGEDVGEADR